MVCMKLSPKEEFARELLSDALKYSYKLEGSKLIKAREKIWQTWKKEIEEMVDVAIKIAKGFGFKHRIKIEDPDKKHPVEVIVSKFINLCTDSKQELDFQEFSNLYANEMPEIMRIMIAMAETVVEEIYRIMLEKK
ncbi:MAG: hypothetical protein QXT77_08645 [Candidatus Methanomethylicaceae archaeon]